MPLTQFNPEKVLPASVFSPLNLPPQHIDTEPEFLLDCTKDGVIREHRERKMRARAASRVLKKHADYEKNALRMMFCGQRMEYDKFGDGLKRATKVYCCGLRTCPRCAHHRSKILYGQTVEVCNDMQEEGEEFEPVLFTLTVPNVWDEVLEDEVSRLLKAANRLMKYKAIKDASIGWMKSLEITYNDNRYSASFNTYHPHVHILMMMRKGYYERKNGLYITHEHLGKLWMRALGEKDYDTPYFVSLSSLSDNEKGLSGMIGEVAKYCAKPQGIYDARIRGGRVVGYNVNEEVFMTMHKVMKGRRLVTFGGKMKDYRQKLKLKDVADMEGEELLGENDEHAGKKVVAKEVYEWSDKHNDYVLVKSTPVDDDGNPIPEKAVYYDTS